MYIIKSSSRLGGLPALLSVIHIFGTVVKYSPDIRYQQLMYLQGTWHTYFRVQLDVHTFTFILKAGSIKLIIDNFTNCLFHSTGLR